MPELCSTGFGQPMLWVARGACPDGMASWRKSGFPKGSSIILGGMEELWKFQRQRGQRGGEVPRVFDSTGEAGFQGKLGTNRSLQAIVPFSPSRQISMPMVWAANDPLVHYISSELFDITSSGKPLIIQPPGISNTNQLTNIGKKNRRYRPWPIDVSAVVSPIQMPSTLNQRPADPLVG